jgi:hypothetical protein
MSDFEETILTILFILLYILIMSIWGINLFKKLSEIKNLSEAKRLFRIEICLFFLFGGIMFSKYGLRR